MVTAKTGQCLRGIFFSHIITSNYSFLRNVDTSFIAKMSIYEFDAIILFIGNIPKMTSFPIPFLLTVALIVLQVGLVSLVMVPIFAITGILLAILDHRLLAKNLLYKKVGSLRTRILTELLSDIESIKANSWEDFYIKKLGQVRKKEIEALN